MPEFEYGSVSIHYEVYGSGFPVLLIAPGAMESAIRMWEGMTIDPLAHFVEGFQLIGMDQRNAGRSSGPLDSSDPWGMYARDQLALLDHLGVGRFGVMGACIGGSFALKLIVQAPDRVAVAVLEQPVGITEENRPLYEDMWRSWGARLSGRPGLSPEEIEIFGTSMWDGEFVVSVSRDFVRTCDNPILVLPGTDRYHPTATGREIAALAPNGRVFEPWNDSRKHVLEAAATVRSFLETLQR